MDDLKRNILNSFKFRGFSLAVQASDFLIQQLNGFSFQEQEKWLKAITEHVQTQNISCSHVQLNQIEFALNEIGMIKFNNDESKFAIIDAFDVPKFFYNPNRKQFEVFKKKMISGIDLKANCLKDRYAIIHQKTARHELFWLGTDKTFGLKSKFNLCYVENLLSMTKIENIVILGLLVQLEEGKFYIEDPTGSVPLNLSQTRFSLGLFCEGSFVLAEGCYQEEILKVDSLSLPPPEPAVSSRSLFGTQNTWGGHSSTLLKFSQRLLQLEKANKEDTIIFLSDVQLDNNKVMEKLKILLVGYNNYPPIAIVLMGPFAEKNTSIYRLKELFNKFAELTIFCQHLTNNTELILLPSENDPFAPNILPLFPLPDLIISELKKKWPKVHLATNPCRLQYCTQQILVCRANLFTKFCRNTLHVPKNKELQECFVKTLICQGHLVPLEQGILPIYWDWDAALSLYPLPDLIVIGDSGQSFNYSQSGCTILNTGSFIKSDFCFNVYVPSTKIIEDSEIASNT